MFPVTALPRSAPCRSSTERRQFARFHRTALLLAISAGSAAAQQDYGNRLGQRTAGEVEFRPFGTTVVSEHLDPSVRKWYLPQELLHEYKWRPWETRNYAREPYRRYRSILSEGTYLYDRFGKYLTRGWVIYDWTEERPREAEGSRILPPEWPLSGLNIVSDRKGRHQMRVTIGANIPVNLTPLTFRKSAFDGLLVDYQSDRFTATGLVSRISHPGFANVPAFEQISFANLTSLFGGRAEAALGDRFTLGATFVNAHHGRTVLSSFQGSPFTGALTASQHQAQITEIILRISDDSPGDPGGAILVHDDVEITTRLGHVDTVLVGSRIGFRPEKEGGFVKEGARVAEGGDAILLRYVLADDPETSELEGLQGMIGDVEVAANIRNVRFRLVVVDDYRVEVTSSNQTNAEGKPVFLTVTRARRNTRDGSNKKQVVFDYGLPTANQIAGFTAEARGLLGFDLYGALDVNHRYRQFPYRRAETHRARSGILGDETALAWMANLARDSFPWFCLVEAFYMDEDYSTSSFVADGAGNVDYEDETRSLYDFVDDNDDNDRLPDQRRLHQDARIGVERLNETLTAQGFADNAVFPGWDTNNDFISDFNQNGNRLQENLLPDYEEPFLRYSVDRPEFLFGIDLNNNGWIDRFENDNEPDYPYKSDRKGYNAYLRRHFTPELNLTVGRTRQSLISDDREAVTSYAILALEKDLPGIGMVRVFDMLKRAGDEIPDDLVQWVQQPQSRGLLEPFADPLAATDTWINSAFLGFERRADFGVNFESKLKYETVRQAADGSGHKRNTRLFGWVNKASWIATIGNLTVEPRLKSALLRDDTPYSIGKSEREEWTGTADILLRYPFLRRSQVELGVEQAWFDDSLVKEGRLSQGEATGDYRNLVIALQVTNRSDYLGYRFNTQFGYMMNWRNAERYRRSPLSETGGLSFLTIYAALR